MKNRHEVAIFFKDFLFRKSRGKSRRTFFELVKNYTHQYDMHIYRTNWDTSCGTERDTGPSVASLRAALRRWRWAVSFSGKGDRLNAIVLKT